MQSSQTRASNETRIGAQMRASRAGWRARVALWRQTAALFAKNSAKNRVPVACKGQAAASSPAPRAGNSQPVGTRHCAAPPLQLSNNFCRIPHVDSKKMGESFFLLPAHVDCRLRKKKKKIYRFQMSIGNIFYIFFSCLRAMSID